MTEEQQKKAQFWRYLTRGITWNHKNNWYNEILRNKGVEEAELFLKYVKYSNRVEL